MITRRLAQGSFKIWSSFIGYLSSGMQPLLKGLTILSPSEIDLEFIVDIVTQEYYFSEIQVHILDLKGCWALSTTGAV